MSDERESLPIESHLATLLEEYKCCVVSKHDTGCFDQYNDDLLQRLMTVLSELPDIPLQSFILHTKDTTTRQLHPTDSSRTEPQPCYLDDVLASFIAGETICFPRFVQLNRWPDVSSLLVLDTNTVDDSVLMILRDWEKGLVFLSKVIKNMSPSEMHATVSLTNFDPDNTNDCHHHLGCQIYHTTGILLCCRAIQQLSTDENNTVSVNSSSSSVRPRWQRCQSLLFETIRQYDQFHKLYGDNNQPMMMNYSLSIWINHVLPSTSQWNCVVWGNDYFPQEQIHIPTNAIRIWRWRMAYEAVTVVISGRLAIQVVTMEGNNNGDALRALMSSILDNVVFGQLDFICEHYWRFYYIVTLKHHQDVLQSYKDSLMTEVGPTATVAILYFTLLAGKDNVEDESWDLLCGLSSTWSNTDIAILSSVGWEIRPNIWSKTYQWHLFFPCINDLLIGGVTDAIDDVESQRHHVSISPYGYKLLSQLIELCSIRSIKKPSDDSTPDSPLGTFQHLFNVMVTQMDATKVDKSHCVRTATESFRIAKSLLNVFQPSSQTEMVEKLLLQCPYPSLRPKIIDLLRTFVDWNDRQGEGKVWSLIDKMFFVHLDDRLNNEMTSSNISLLVDDSETYVAALGLLHIWLKYKRSIPIFAQFDRLSDRLDHMHTSLTRIMTEFGISSTANQSNSQSPLLYFQLNLLEHSIRESIEAVNMIQDI